jgi:hypothetical protein
LFVGYLIAGFMLGFIIGLDGGYRLAKRSEASQLQKAIRAQTPLEGFKTAKATQFAPPPDFFDSVPDTWRDETR